MISLYNEQLETLAEHYKCQIMVIEDNKEGKKIGILGKSDKKITLTYNGKYFKNYKKNTIQYDFIKQNRCVEKLSIFYCIYKAIKNKINENEIKKLIIKIENKIQENNKRLLKQSQQKKATLMTFDFGSSSKNLEKIIEPVTLTDIFARIFCLNDVTTNDGNFGFIKKKNPCTQKLLILKSNH